MKPTCRRKIVENEAHCRRKFVENEWRQAHPLRQARPTWEWTGLLELYQAHPMNQDRSTSRKAQSGSGQTNFQTKSGQPSESRQAHMSQDGPLGVDRLNRTKPDPPPKSSKPNRFKTDQI